MTSSFISHFFQPDFQKKTMYIIGIIMLIYVLKPTLFFKPNGKSRIYGVGYDEEGYKKTLFNFQFIIIFIVLIIYMIV